MEFSVQAKIWARVWTRGQARILARLDAGFMQGLDKSLSKVLAKGLDKGSGKCLGKSSGKSLGKGSSKFQAMAQARVSINVWAWVQIKISEKALILYFAIFSKITPLTPQRCFLNPIMIIDEKGSNVLKHNLKAFLSVEVPMRTCQHVPGARPGPVPGVGDMGGSASEHV